MAEYPPLPGVFGVPTELILTWARATAHSLLVAQWSSRELAERYAHHELTTGCICRERRRMRCPKHTRPHPVERYGKAPACMCLYDLRKVAGVAGTHPLDPFREGWHRGVYAFRIHPKPTRSQPPGPSRTDYAPSHTPPTGAPTAPSTGQPDSNGTPRW